MKMGEQIKFTVGGAEFLLSKEDVELKLKAVEPENVREVYIEVNGTRFPIKQALACATGLLRGTFTTHDAMRVFRKLAFSVGTESAIEIDTMPERIYTMLKSLAQFDKLHLRGVIRGLLAKTDRDNCFIGNYYRAVANIESLLSLKSARDLQAISMVARGLFELAVDTKLISIIPDAVKKIVTFSDVEKLRAARKIVKYKAANPSAALDATVHDTFITNNARRIDAERAAVWPGMKKVEHWSARNLADRVAPEKLPPLHLTAAPVDAQPASTQLLVPRWSTLVDTTAMAPANSSAAPAERVSIAPPRVIPLSMAAAESILEVDSGSIPDLVSKAKRTLRFSRIREAFWIAVAGAEALLLIFWLFVQK